MGDSNVGSTGGFVEIGGVFGDTFGGPKETSLSRSGLDRIAPKCLKAWLSAGDVSERRRFRRLFWCWVDL